MKIKPNELTPWSAPVRPAIAKCTVVQTQGGSRAALRHRVLLGCALPGIQSTGCAASSADPPAEEALLRQCILPPIGPVALLS